MTLKDWERCTAMSSVNKVRSDALPEHLEWKDTGCSEAPKCLECPFSRCRYELHRGMATLRKELRERAQ